MIDFLDFILVNVTLFMLVLLFDFGLSSNNNFKKNRFTLLLIPIISFIPLLEFPNFQLSITESFYKATLPLFQVNGGGIESTSLNYWWIYFSIGGLYFVWRLIGSLTLYFRGSLCQNQLTKYSCYLVKENGNYSIFNRIFLLKEDFNNELIIKHEEAHVRQKHTLDLLLSEVYIALFWINPMVWRLKILIRQNHEYLADNELIINSSQSKTEYIHLLLDRALNTDQFSLGNYFSINSLISKRIIMLNKTKSQKTWKTLTITSIMVGSVIFAGSCNKKETMEAEIVDTQEMIGDTVDNEVFTKVETMPEFVGGEQALFKYLGENIKYPKNCKEEGIEGIVYVTFIVNKEGEIKDTKILRGVHEDLDAEAMRVISSMPDWNPGSQDGKKVNVVYNIPINFKMKKKKKLSSLSELSRLSELSKLTALGKLSHLRI